MLMRIAPTLALAASLLSACLSVPDQPCREAVTGQLQRLKVDPNNVESISYAEKTRRTRNKTLAVGIDAWVDLASCSGGLVINMTLQCRVKQVYAQGECRVRGVDAY